MPKLTRNTEAARQIQVMIALQAHSQGMTKKDACDKAGISEDIYDRWISKDDGAIEELQTSIVEAERFRLAQIVSAQASLLASILESARTSTDPFTKLQVLKYIDGLRDRLEIKHGVHSERDEAQAYMLSGPRTRVEKSQMHPQGDTGTTINIRTRPDGSVDLSIPPAQRDIIDIFPELSDGDNSIPTASSEETDDLGS